VCVCVCVFGGRGLAFLENRGITCPCPDSSPKPSSPQLSSYTVYAILVHKGLRSHETKICKLVSDLHNSTRYILS